MPRHTIHYTFILLLSSFFTVVQAQPSSDKNTDRFAGLHFDFHAGLTDSGIGKTFTPEMIDSFLRIVQPDFIQVDCKGHPGISSYPTKAGNPAPAIEKDIMKIWRTVSDKYHVPLYVHYSGIWDNRALQLHPQWARYNADGRPDKNANSLFSGYADSLLIPQLKELATVYHINGVWVDGDCWVLAPDYSEEAKRQFTMATGIKDIPVKKDDPHFFEWMEFHRKAFRDYITKYANAVHAAAPGFKVTSNWSFSSMMPEPVDVPVDYLSGDVAGTNSLYSSAFESRCLALQGKPWDLMSWSFAWKNGSKATKSIPQLEQEAAEVLAMGGGFQTYWQQNRDGTPEPYQFSKMKEIIRFCKERKAYTFQSEIIPQIGLLYSTYAWKRLPANNLYSSHGQEKMKGILNILLDAQLPVEILMDHQLKERMDSYPLLIIPEWEQIDPAIRPGLIDYVQKGGNLIVIGAKAIAAFADELGITIDAKPITGGSIFAGHNNRIVMMHAGFQPVRIKNGIQKIGIRLNADDWRFPTDEPLASVRQLGKGKIGGIYMDMGDFYNNNKNPLSIALLTSVIEKIFPRFVSTVVCGSGNIHQVLSRKNDNIYVHLINAGGEHSNPNVLVYDDIAPAENIEVKLEPGKRPKSITLQPGNTTIPFTYKNGIATVHLPSVKLYDILEIKF
jgi:hypothetical protein